MKKPLLNLLIATAIFTIIFSGCKKDDITSDKIVGKWYLKTYVRTETINGVTKQYTGTYTNGETYYDIRTDGTITIVQSDTESNSVWKLSSHYLIIDLRKNEIITLTDTSLKLHSNFTVDGNTYDETLNFSK